VAVDVCWDYGSNTGHTLLQSKQCICTMQGTFLEIIRDVLSLRVPLRYLVVSNESTPTVPADKWRSDQMGNMLLPRWQ
jgi:hypothetical protein